MQGEAEQGRVGCGLCPGAVGSPGELFSVVVSLPLDGGSLAEEGDTNRSSCLSGGGCEQPAVVGT